MDGGLDKQMKTAARPLDAQLEASLHHAWFRAKVQEALTIPAPTFPTSRLRQILQDAALRPFPKNMDCSHFLNGRLLYTSPVGDAPC